MSEHFDESSQDEERDDVRDKLLTLWEALGSPEPPDIPEEALVKEGISQADYAEWRLDLEDEKVREREVLADAARVDEINAERAARGLEPLKPDYTQEELDAIERRKLEAELRARRLRELEGEAQWRPEDDDATSGKEPA